MRKPPREGLFFYLFLALFFLSVGALSLFLLSGERKRSQLLAEYEADKLGSALMETLRQNPGLELQSLRGQVLGFGIYTESGQALERFGSAPLEEPTPQAGSPAARFHSKAHSLVLIRSIGVPPGMMGPGSPHARPRGMGMGPGMRRMSPFGEAPRTLFLELPVESYWIRQRVLGLAQALVPLALLGVGLLLALLYRRNSQYRRRLTEQAELARLGEASRTLSHEIKNPLSAIRIQTGLLKKTLPEDRRGELRVIEEEIQRLAMLTDRVGDFLRDPRGQPRELELAEFLKELALRYERRLRCSCQGQDPLRVRFDPQRLRSVLENLINNALESGDGEVEVVCAGQRNRVEVAVLDRGAGIPPEIRAKVFDPFFTSKAKGSGIGLAVARRFVEAAGGRLSLEDRPGGGTSARILLPREAV
jgi:two-component system sensor histidine kinase HydH